MCGIEYWWCQLRAKVECQATCTYLEKEPDQQALDLLKFPKGVALVDPASGKYIWLYPLMGW